jgi:hypothetical protein
MLSQDFSTDLTSSFRHLNSRRSQPKVNISRDFFFLGAKSHFPNLDVTKFCAHCTASAVTQRTSSNLTPSRHLSTAPSRCRYVYELQCLQTCWQDYDRRIILTAPSTEPQVVPHQAEACQSAEAEPPYPPMDPSENWQHHQVRCALLSPGTGRCMRWRLYGEGKNVDSRKMAFYARLERELLTWK